MSWSLPENSTQLKEILSTIIGNAPYGIVAIDFQGNCTIVNTAGADLLGEHMDNLIDSDIRDHLEVGTELRGALDDALEMGRKQTELRDCLMNNKFYDFFFRPIDSGLMLVSVDITSRVSASSEQSRLVEQLERANKDLEEFAYISAHDMKSPLHSLCGLVELMQQQSAIKAEHLELFEMLQKTVTSMQKTVSGLNEVLEYRQSLTGQVHTDTKLCEVIEEVRGSLTHLLSTSKGRVNQDFHECPSLQMTQMHVRSIFYNMVCNSLKYASPDRVPEIHIESHRTTDGYEMVFTDNGLGIDLDRHGKRLFGLFNRFHDSHDGAGIGLYTVKAIVQSYGGRIDVESEPDRGTRFRIRIPGHE